VTDAGVGLTIDGNRYIDINPNPGWWGVSIAEIQVMDTGGLTVTDSLQVTVLPDNFAPHLDNLPDQWLPVNGSADNAIDLWS
jgi:hypothetical protein